MSVKPRRASHAPRREHMIAALVVAALIVVAIAAAFRATAEESVAVTPRPAPTQVTIIVPSPVVPGVCPDAQYAADKMDDQWVEMNNATSEAAEKAGMAANGKNPTKNLSIARRSLNEAARLNRVVEKARDDFYKKAEACLLADGR